MLTHNLGYPRIGSSRELKRACESYWASSIGRDALLAAASELRTIHWRIQQEAGMDLIPCNDSSLYDQVLDHTLMVGAIPSRYRPLRRDDDPTNLDLYFAMARGYQKDGLDLIAMEMTKWFDTNYHYLVPEFTRDQGFALTSRKVLQEFKEAKALGINAKPVLIGPVTYLLLGKEKEPGFHRLDLLDRLLPVYVQILRELQAAGAEWVQLDEPYLTMDLEPAARDAYETAYARIAAGCPNLKILLATYFGDLGDNLDLVASLPVGMLHMDFCRAPAQLERAISKLKPATGLSLGLVDGRNIWKNDFEQSLQPIRQAVAALGEGRVAVAPSCSLLHVPCDLEPETTAGVLPAEVGSWLAFARQKLDEVATLRGLAQPQIQAAYLEKLAANRVCNQNRRNSPLIHRPAVKRRATSVTPRECRRGSVFRTRQELQHQRLKLPLFPTTTIGSFPQTAEIRKLRQRLKRGELSLDQYEVSIRAEIEQTVRWQEQLDLDVLVHGEFERNDMVEYFGELLNGFAFTAQGWVQSYGSRCVKPPVLYGDVEREEPMTVQWTQYAQSLTDRPVKGMLTGPITILQWSFVRDDQPRSATARQIALAIRDEVHGLEAAGIGIIQIDEPAIREGLPLRKAEWPGYLRWAVDAFRLASAGVDDKTQIHTHMCYSEFNDILPAVADMDADVITIETSRSQMELLDAFAKFQYPNEIGPGVYDIHSPRVPTADEMIALLRVAQTVVPARNLWVNPDCGLKTRKWPETRAALAEMVQAAKAMRSEG